MSNLNSTSTSRTTFAPKVRSTLVAAWGQILEFSGARGEATYLWPRWFVLRAVGLVYIVAFAGILKDQMVLIGPEGLGPISEYLQHIAQTNPGIWSSFLAAPTLFWISSGEVMINILSWIGMVSAVALVLNLWPRFALSVCWLIFLSFVSTWHAFSGAQLDKLLLEAALLCIPFAPRGFRPKLGEHSAPSPLVMFMVRWFLFRVMFEAGIVKLAAGDPHWRDFSAMELMYETAPFPTFLGFLNHQMPRIYHVFQILLTFFAELAAPLLAVFAGRRGRWIAIISWTALQAGIQLTNNFGWLNMASIGIGLLFLDDQMIQAALRKFRLSAIADWIKDKTPLSRLRPTKRWQYRTLAVALWIHFAFSLFYFAKASGFPVQNLPAPITTAVKSIEAFGSVNEYYLYAKFAEVRTQVEFLGSNDGGKTWRTYQYRYMPQQPDEISPHIAPWFVRFDATLELEAFKPAPSLLFRVIASHLLKPNPEVVALFRENPFPDAPPTLMRIRSYRLRFTDWSTYQETGNYWEVEPAGDYLPAMRVDRNGQIVPFDMSAGEAALGRGDTTAAMTIFARQYQEGYNPAGLRLADYFLHGIGTPKAKAQALILFSELAADGESQGELNLGICYEHGLGTPIDLQQSIHWYQRAAKHGSAFAHFNLGAMHTGGRQRIGDDVAALTHLLKARQLTEKDDSVSKRISNYILQQQPALVQRLKQRMTPKDITRAEKLAAR